MPDTASPAAHRVKPLFPPLVLSTLVTTLMAGVFADGAWEIWARAVTPLWVGGPLQPAALVQSVFGFNNVTLAEAIHLVVGILFYPLGYLYIARPIADRFLPFLPWPVVAFGYGVGLWVFALYFMAHLAAGLPAFLGFIPLAWASLVGHVLLGLVLGLVVRLRS
ncbi:hypothetical protein [Stappia sp.]|uniref:hypothetical protein n=1 Tax=Stappia sp. TaxID=1870903 RepID=UPI003A9A2C53